MELFFMMLIGLVDYEDEDEDECEENANEDKEYKDSEDQDIELEEAASIYPGEINDIIDCEDEANPNEHQDAGEHQEDDGDHQESKENIGIEELSGSQSAL